MGSNEQRDVPEFKGGALADGLNAVAKGLTRKVVGDGMNVRPLGGNLALSVKRRRSPSVPQGAILASIATNAGGGSYTWTAVDTTRPGPGSGTAAEITGSTSVAVGTKVWVYKAGAAWVFYSAAAGTIKCARYTNATSGYVVNEISWTTQKYDDDGLLDTAAGAWQNERFVAQEECLCHVVAHTSFYLNTAQTDIASLGIQYYDASAVSYGDGQSVSQYVLDLSGTGTSFNVQVSDARVIPAGGFVAVSASMRSNGLASTIRTGGIVSVTMTAL